jgi:hypothetical protein
VICRANKRKQGICDLARSFGAVPVHARLALASMRVVPGSCRSVGWSGGRSLQIARPTQDARTRPQQSPENRFSRGNAVALMVPLPLPFMRTSVCPSVQGVHTLGTGRGY